MKKCMNTMPDKERDIVTRQQHLLLKARVAIACGRTDLLSQIEGELEYLNTIINNKN